MTVFVVTNGDFPNGVVTNQARALQIVAERNAAVRKEKGDPLAGYWRVHSFELDAEPRP